MHRNTGWRLGALLLLGASLVPLAARAQATNPLEVPSTLPLQAPPFDRIKDSDFAPAFDAGIKQGLAEYEAIANDTAPPTFENTIVAMEKAGLMLDRVQRDFNVLAGADTNPAIQKIESDEAPKLAAYEDAIYLNPKLFARVKSLYDHRDALKLDPESAQLLKIYYQDFVHAGAELADADKATLRELNKQISTLETAFQQKLLAATKAGGLVVADKAELAGLSPAQIAAAAQAAKARGLAGKYVIPLQNTTQQPTLASLTDRDVREKLFMNSWTRAEKGDANDTRATIETLAQLRARKAKLLGYPDFAAYKLYDQMAKTPAAVLSFMGQMVQPTAEEAAREARDLQALIDKSGAHFKLTPWDWEFYSDKLKAQRFHLDDNAMRPYFELDNVLKNGLLYAANQLYGITFKERHDLPVWNPDVRVFDVLDADGSQLGLMYFDYFKRDNKSGGAWTSSFVNQSKLLNEKPVVYNVANFTKPAPGEPALLTFDNVTTMFHEFGHALHALFASQEYPSLSGTHVARDFVEFPSQFNEHWALYPAVLAHYAVDYKTGKKMPQALIDEIKKSETYDQGYEFGELLAAAELDMQWHTLSPEAPKQDVDKFEQQALVATHTNFPDVPPRYRSTYFAHIWSNGYSAGYYAYLWSEMLDDDAYSWFIQHGGMTRANGQRFRDMILSKGHSEDYGPMFRSFYGKDPEIGPMLEHRGLVKPGE